MGRVDPPGISLPEPREVGDLAAELGGSLDAGLAARRVTRIVAPEHAARAEDLVVVTVRARARAMAPTPGVVLCPSSVQGLVPPGHRWVHEHCFWVVAELLKSVEGAPFAEGSSAVVHPEAEVDPSVQVRAGAVVLPGARIGKGSVVCEGAVVYGRVSIGERVVVGPNAVVGRPGFGWTTGPAGQTVRVPQLGGVVVEDDVEIGALSTVDAGTLSPTVLERGVKLDAQVHVGHNVRIGAGTLVAAQSGFAGSVQVGRGVRIGGQVGIADHLNIGDGARIAAGSGVISDVEPGVTVAGYPAVRRFLWLRAWAGLLGGKRRNRR